jgi:hypothetical protein
MRGFIEKGASRTFAFKYELKRAQLDVIISYLRTVPVQPLPRFRPHYLGGE